MPEEELHCKTMMGVVPLMSFAPATSTPDANVVNKLRGIIETGLKSQKQIASENGLSQTMMSQYMNGATRVKGWTATDSLLDSWADNFNAQLQIHTDRIEKQKTQDKEVKMQESKFSCTEYAQASVIRLNDEPKYDETTWNTGSTSDVDTSSYEDDGNFANMWSPEDQLNIYQQVPCAAENLAIYSNPPSGDWGNYDIHRVFYPQPSQFVNN
jgi:transcriptional regulator with XRE-family HTH domain